MTNLSLPAHIQELNDQRATQGKRPIVPAIVTAAYPSRSYPGCFTVEISCPYCPKTHTHGVENLTDPAGHRLSHCNDGNSNPGYYLLIPSGLKPTKN